MDRRRTCATVHPRSRGEHFISGTALAGIAGSSPLARGTRARAVGRLRNRRFIPARAGNTEASDFQPRPAAVHPRSRGEHLGVPPEVVSTFGSSPLARGTPTGVDAASDRYRFIPARAGNTPLLVPTAWVPTVHPRSRGEHETWQVFGGLIAGSSPLARGTHRCGDFRAASRRFIPARAGNTSVDCIVTSPPYGSSPLARGTLPSASPTGVSGRFIPARAGNTP